MNPLLTSIQEYYDEHAIHKLHGFIEGNTRVEKAWKTIEKWAPSNPKRVLEVGCGIGDICWRMSRYWQNAEVFGLDISPKSIQIANQLFASSKITFIEGTLLPGCLEGKFDLIIFIDTYEHIAKNDRPLLHEVIQQLLHSQGRIILSVPTPRHLRWLKQHHPKQIQPVDEDIDVPCIVQLSQEIGAEILMYQDVNVWKPGDYAHIILGSQPAWDTPASPPLSKHKRISRILKSVFSQWQKPLVPNRNDRLALVRQKLGSNIF